MHLGAVCFILSHYCWPISAPLSLSLRGCVCMGILIFQFAPIWAVNCAIFGTCTVHYIFHAYFSVAVTVAALIRSLPLLPTKCHFNIVINLKILCFIFRSHTFCLPSCTINMELRTYYLDIKMWKGPVFPPFQLHVDCSCHTLPHTLNTICNYFWLNGFFVCSRRCCCRSKVAVAVWSIVS